MKGDGNGRTGWLAIAAALALCGAWAAAAAEKVDEKTPMEFSFNSRGYGNFGVDRVCISYARIANAKKARPLFLCGWGRRGELTLTIENQGIGGLFTVNNAGAGIVEYKDYPLTFGQGAAVGEFTCAEWAKGQPRVRMTLTGFKAWEQIGDMMGAFLRVRTMPEPNTPESKLAPQFKVKADFALTVGEKTATFKEQPAMIRLDIVAGRGYSKVFPVWRVTYDIKCKVKGSDLGLTGEDAGELDVTLAGGAFARVPELSSRTDMKKAIERLEKDSLGTGELDSLKMD